VGKELKARALLARAAALEEGELARFLKGLAGPVRRAVEEAWWARWHKGQVPEKEDWDVWLLRAGRGFGKTLAGAEWVWARARETPGALIALVGANVDDVYKVMVAGPAGLQAAAASGEEARWVASQRRVDFSTGARAFAYSAETPRKLRGPEHDHAWCDELAKWAHGDETWDTLAMGMRRGERPRIVITTTPRTIGLIRRIRELPGFTETLGRTRDNRHLAARVRARYEETYGRTRLARQELDGELFDDVEGALWTPALIEACRCGASGVEHARVVVGVDPPITVDGGCGIVVCALGRDGIGRVLADCTVAGLSPEGWARVAAAAAQGWRAHRVVAEANNGGKMVESVLRGADTGLPVRLVHASDGKSARAEPVAALFESRRARFAGLFPELEDQLCRLVVGGGYDGPGSPDRADAMVWALSELMLGERRAEPWIRQL
jgi:phage terminase large subunit-like protein